MNDYITLPGGAMALAANVLVSEWIEYPRHELTLLIDGTRVTYVGERADQARRIIKEAHDIKNSPKPFSE